MQLERENENRRRSIERKKIELEADREKLERSRNEADFSKPLEHFAENTLLPKGPRSHHKGTIANALLDKQDSPYDEPTPDLPPVPPRPDTAFILAPFFHNLDEPDTPSFAERGSFGRVSTMSKKELAIERRVQLWDLLDELSTRREGENGEETTKSEERRVRTCEERSDELRRRANGR